MSKVTLKKLSLLAFLILCMPSITLASEDDEFWEIEEPNYTKKRNRVARYVHDDGQVYPLKTKKKKQ